MSKRCVLLFIPSKVLWKNDLFDINKLHREQPVSAAPPSDISQICMLFPRMKVDFLPRNNNNKWMQKVLSLVAKAKRSQQECSRRLRIRSVACKLPASKKREREEWFCEAFLFFFS